MLRIIISMAVAMAMAATAVAAEPVTFKDRRVTVIVGYPPGGGADLTARLVTPLLTKYLPGNPNIVVQNMPGAEGVKALNFFANQVKPDGLTLYVGSANEFDPIRSRSSVALYNLNKLNFVGGNARFQSLIVINESAKSRLFDKASPPVTMGSMGYPRSGALTTAWGIGYLGWNARWVTGYKGTAEISLALERGEIDMTSGNTNDESLLRAVRTGNFEVLTLAGTAPAGVPVLPEFVRAPQIVDQVGDKIEDPIANAAFKYWLTISSIDKWLALPADTPKEIIEAYRTAFSKVAIDPDLNKDGAFLDLVLTDYRNFENAAKILEKTPQEAVDFMASLLRKQGLDVAQ